MFVKSMTVCLLIDSAYFQAGYLQGKDVKLSVSLSGIQVSLLTGAPLMNHILKRISYATCDPSCCLFSFLAREQGSPAHLQHCHTFRTPASSVAEDLNAVVGTAFRVAYATRLQVLTGYKETQVSIRIFTDLLRRFSDSL